MTTVRISEARQNLADLGSRVALRGERVVVERHGKNLFALVPMEDVELLERIEDETDIRLARKAMKEKGRNIPWEKVKKDLGL
ncbi:MAG: type II toxin-antitoxin system Phd/YefM family antitoxin [Planctomycetaceae bacterium]|nr:type II toxin-antitoxin system Phd/YefM family antitoxin [Planctomycetaceae bacterium]